MSITAHDHPITIEPVGRRLRVRFAGTVVADTARALVMHETIYPPVYYIPREDAAMAAFRPSEHTSRCPHKGTASYFSLEEGGERAENAVWSYEEPLPGVAEIKDHLAFYPRYVAFELDDQG